MSAIHTWACFLLWISFTTQDKTPDVTVSCVVSEECVLPCSFPPDAVAAVEWFRQNVAVFKFEPEDDDSNESSEEEDGGDHGDHEPLEGRAAIFPHLVSHGNATLILRKTGLKDRGTYRCHVRSSKGEHNAKVIVKVEAPIRGLSLELSRLSGYEEMKCIVRHVFPAPRVTWATEPPTFEDLRPVTRMLADKQGLYTVDSRLKMLHGQPDLIYICKMSTSYGGPAWTSSLREREIRGTQGRDLTIPCSAPPYLNNPFLHWTFSNGEDPSHILTYDSRTGDAVSSPPWRDHVELDGFRVPFGDGSLRLMDPKHAEHTGSYTCVFSVPFSSHTERSDVTIADPAGFRVPFGDGSLRLMDPKHAEHTGSYTCVFSVPFSSHTERSDVTIADPAGFRVPFGDGSLRLMDPKHAEHTGSYTCVFSVPFSSHSERSDVTIADPAAGRSLPEAPSYWWIVGLVVGVLVLALAAMLAYLKAKGSTSKPRNDPEEVTELHSVKASAADRQPGAQLT